MKQEKITVSILNKEYQFATAAEEKESLLAATHHLDHTMREIKTKNSSLSFDKIALMAAVNIAHELIKSERLNQTFDQQVMHSVRNLNEKLEQALELEL